MKMKVRVAPAAIPPIATPSTSPCGFLNINSRSLNVPGSDSSALQQRYLAISPFGKKLAFFPVGKPAPPRPRSPLASSSSTSASGSSSRTAFFSAVYPPRFS
jgi:hypothetical protein